MNTAELTQSDRKVYLILDTIQALLITSAVGIVGFNLWGITHSNMLPASFAATGLIVFLLLVNRSVGKAVRQAARERESSFKGSLYGQFNPDNEDVDDASINLLRSRAIQYCEDLIADYRLMRSQSQIIYYVFQVATIVLSGVTPILVLLDKTETGLPWLKWLPVLFPAVASIVTSISTSFPFQENAVAANTAVEFLEAELEKFILGVTNAYRFSDLPPRERRIKLQEAVESFIIQVNKIHLKQLQNSGDAESQKKGPDMSSDAASNPEGNPG
ncbi:DUF4231 domain-containing protein [Limnothrix sp. FACHB-881]|uniref:DUF4231 domain-containing protein n=1 Tax=Limnothrix sp. FACHB-881 TaxID=2692819 RepID=UPI001687E7B9|nr:DUF4231 domain-containing protein [Limnothrix sp. FACHB-881]MBD2633894.1 DUF4231 domain-containing protein [Limnothrix sp. FACHB-881]